MTSQTLEAFCYSKLKDAIIRGEFVPGEKLTIAKLKTFLNVGPTPIREALSKLSTTGLVQAESNRGFYVKKISEAEIRDIYSTFIKIEILALTQAMERGDSSWEANILASLHKLSVIENSPSSFDPELWLKLNEEFHYALIEGCQSPTLLQLRDHVYRLFDRYCHLGILINEKAVHLINKEHHEIAKAVIARDSIMVFRLITMHIEKSFIQVMAKLKETGSI